MNIAEEWIRDMPQQFQGKPKIEAFFKAIGKQLDGLNQALRDIRDKTSLDVATGKNLDYIGDNIILSRKEANIILRKAITAEMTDGNYRQVLQYKSIQNSCDCTYYDIMWTISLLWDTRNITYYEDPDRPATIILTMPTISVDVADPSVGRVLALKASGVSLIYAIGYWIELISAPYEKIRFSNLIMKWCMSFYSFVRRKNRNLDGTWLLDGSRLLGATAIPVPTSVVIRGSVMHMVEKSGAHLLVDTKARMTEQLRHTKEIIRSKVNQTNREMYFFDGSWMLDGSKRLDSIRWLVPVKMIIHSEMQTRNRTYFIGVSYAEKLIGTPKGRLQSVKNQFSIQEREDAETKAAITSGTNYREKLSGEVTIKQNIWYLDGSQVLDGSRYLNAIEKKEVI